MPREYKKKMGAETVEQFADLQGLNKSTLYRWQVRIDFLPKVKDIREKWARERTGDVVDAIFKTAVKGNPLSQKLWMQVFEGFTEKQDLTVTQKQKVELGVNDIRFIIEQLPDQFKEKFYGYIREIIDTAQSLRSAGQLEDRIVTEQESSELVLGEADHDAQDLPGKAADVVAFGHKECLCADLERPAQPNNYKGASRWW